MPKPASRVEKIPPYLFARIDKKKAEARARGIDLVDLGVGDPDIPTPPHIVKAMQEALKNPKNHRYPDYEGTPALRRAAAEWFFKRYGVKLDPDREVRHPHRLEGGHSPPALGLPGGRRHRPHPFARIPRLQGHVAPCRRHALYDAAAGRERLQARLRRHP